MKKDEVLSCLHQNENYFYKNYGIKILAIFGSVAREESTLSSDIDLLYEIEDGKKLSIFKYLKLLKELEEKLGSKVDLVRTKTLKQKVKENIENELVYV